MDLSQYSMSRVERLKWDELNQVVCDENLQRAGGDRWSENDILDRTAWLWLRWKAVTDLYFLAAWIFGLKDAKDRTSGRHRLDPSIHRTMAMELQSEDDALILYPRLHLKSTFVKFLIIFYILQNPFVRIGLWSRTSSLAEKMLKHVKILLTRPIIRELFPELIPPKKEWEVDRRNELTLVRPKRDEDEQEYGDEEKQESQVTVWGIEGTVTGSHYDRHLYDDIINEQSVTTADQIDKVETWWEHVQAIIEPTGTEKMIGTRYHERDIYGTVISEGYFPIVSTHAAIVNGKPFYSFFTMKDLRRLKRRMKDNFSPQMMNIPVPPENRIFSPPYPHYKDTPEDPEWYISLDPSLGKKYSNKQGIMVGCVSKSDPVRLYAVEAYGVLLPGEELAEHLVNKIVQYRPKRVGIELGLMEHLMFIIETKISMWEAEHGELIRPLFVPISIGNTRKASKLALTVGAFLKSKQMLLGPNCKAFEVQADMYNPNSDDNDDDILDAGQILIRTIEHFTQSRWSDSASAEDIFQANMTVQAIMERMRGDRAKAPWARGLVNTH